MSKEWRTHTTPREKYMHDPAYHALVDALRNMIRKAEFTPSELREACLFAAICEAEINNSPPIFPYETHGKDW